MKPRGFWGDDVGATNIRMRCSAGGGEWVGDGLTNKGTWVGYGECPPRTYMCGGRGLIEGEVKMSDDTALNRIQMACCKRNVRECCFSYMNFQDF